MVDETSPVPEELPLRSPPVLDTAHLGDIHGAFGTIRRHDTGLRRGVRPRLFALLAVMGPGAHRHGGRQRRGRRLHLQPGRPGLRRQPALGAAAPHPGPDREPGDGRAPRRRHRGRPRQAHLRALRPLLGSVLGDRPVHPELPHHRDRVHRGRSGARLLRREQVRLGAPRRARAHPHHRQRQLPPLGAVHVRLHLRQLPGDPAGDHESPERGADRSPHPAAGNRGRGDLRLRASHHRHRRHDRGAVATVLPAVEHHRQADHHALDQLRTGRHGPWLGRDGHRRGRADGDLRLRLRGHPLGGQLHQRRRRGQRAPAHAGRGGGNDVRDRAAERLADRRRGGDALDLLRRRRRLRPAPLAAPRHARRQGLLHQLRRARGAGGLPSS